MYSVLLRFYMWMDQSPRSIATIWKRSSRAKEKRKRKKEKGKRKVVTRLLVLAALSLRYTKLVIGRHNCPHFRPCSARATTLSGHESHDPGPRTSRSSGTLGAPKAPFLYPVGSKCPPSEPFDILDESWYPSRAPPMMAFSKPIRALAVISASLLLYLTFQILRSPPSLSPPGLSGEKLPDMTNDPMNDRP